MDTYGLDLHGADLVGKWLSCVTMNPIFGNGSVITLNKSKTSGGTYVGLCFAAYCTVVGSSFSFATHLKNLLIKLRSFPQKKMVENK